MYLCLLIYQITLSNHPLINLGVALYKEFQIFRLMGKLKRVMRLLSNLNYRV